jgi:hypothetical protein
VLKTQLHSKLNLSHLCHWQDSEDILTGDFFGVLDYLPRQPYLFHFLENVEHLNEREGRLELDRVDWETVEMLFWSRCAGHDDSTEPDVVLVSNRWVIVVEAKLGSGFGEKQPWREYLVGQQIAESRGLPRDAVHYVIVSRAILHEAQVFGGLELHQRDKLEPRTLWFRWLDAVTLVDRWFRRHDAGERQTPKNEIRMLGDLLGALRRRRTLSFCGFSFTNHQPVREAQPPIFCPSFFNGFLCKGFVKCDSPPSIGFLARFQGFLRETCSPVMRMESIWLHRFRGFVRSAELARAPSGTIFCSRGFKGFVNDAPPCVTSATMAGLQRRLFMSTFRPVVPMESVWLRRFRGFVSAAQSAHAPSGTIFCSRGFKGFMNDAPPCVASATMAGLPNNEETVK